MTMNSLRKTYIIIIRNALYFPEINVTLISLFIICLTGLQVIEEPNFMATNPTPEHHSIYVPYIDIIFPWSIKGILSYLPTYLPTSDKVNQRRLTLRQRIVINPTSSE